MIRPKSIAAAAFGLLCALPLSAPANAQGIGGAATAALLVAAVAIGMRQTAPRAPVAPPESVQVANVAPEASSIAVNTRTETLDYMFPDAAPLARFSDSYSTDVATSSDVLFAGETGAADDDL